MTDPPSGATCLVWTAAEVAVALGIDTATVYRLIREGSIPAVNVGTRARPSWRIGKLAFERWLATPGNPPLPKPPPPAAPRQPADGRTLREQLGMRPKRK